MKITIITPDFSHNCLGRAWTLAKILEKTYDVEIVGPLFGKDLWEPLKNIDIPYRYVRVNKVGYSFPTYLKKILTLIDGDLVYSSKLYLSSFVPAVIAKEKLQIPHILDIDDWERGFVMNALRNKSLITRFTYYSISTAFWGHLSSYWQKYIPEKLSYLPDAITVSNSFLKRKFGGSIIWHTRDEKIFDPKLYTPENSKRSIGINDNLKVVLFFGTPKPYKGVEDLINAMALVDQKDVVLVIAGLGNDPYSRYVRELGRKQLGEKFIGIGNVPFHKIPEIVSIADVYVIPQKKSPATVGQMPAKVFDAMAMAKPIVATNVSDLPYVLKKCGIIVEPGDIEKIAEEIKFLLENPSIAKKLGKKCHYRFIREFSLSAMKTVIKKVVSYVA
ncbi:glycosyltransferase [Pyrococcus yayanosii]|uniref:Glycosyl transferase, group 1 n=1 Tax=Pyrococcus yayanosii (strain CH1 / JCM 16557) TaxID=529709 RepID=F8AHP6_PYRYC|nr:glycosyltransferase [Pyrococcus yayanosii]AEH25424.1 glycosyl transferase, group 1 [Pyrococcus yayanosii CH1]